MKYEKVNWLAVFFMACLVACSNSEFIGNLDESDAVSVSPDKYQDFVLVHSIGKKTVLGTNSDLAKVIERPTMTVTFDYEFSMGTHEVTCGEFNSLFETIENDLRLDCPDENLPASSVTYYDAVLYANGKSNVMGEDTAYLYKSAAFDENGHCINLESLSLIESSQGFRLPTEAEWVLVASQGWNATNSWNASNSGYKSHDVCTMPANDVGVCDMAGNVMEWVNDLLGNFGNATVSNFMGTKDGGNLGMRVVKGGSYLNENNAINLYSRGDVYTVTSSTMTDYVGFRLAYGKIPDANWVDFAASGEENSVSLLANSAVVKAKTGTFATILAFRNDITGNLAYVKYSNANLSVNEIQDTMEVYHPEISPDGNLVAFCTGLEGVSGKSRLYVRDLNPEGTNLVGLDVESAAIPRWRVLDSGDTVIVYVDNAGNNEDEGQFQSAATWQVPFAKGKFGIPEKLFNGAYHGGISGSRNLAVTGARKLRARIADSNETVLGSARDTIWYGGEQACNASLSMDGSNRTLFLDFGSSMGQEFVGESYGTHERILIADSTGKLVQSIAAPAGYSFDHAEWALGSLAGKYIVATLANANGAHSKIVLVEVDNGNITELSESDELWHPCFWIKESSSHSDQTMLDVDSAGLYFNAYGGEAAVFLRYKLELLWKYRNTANVIALGSSRMLNGFNPMLMDDDFVTINMANVPNTMYVSKFLFENYIVSHAKNLKYLLISLDLDLWWKSDTDASANFFYTEYLQYPGYVYDVHHNFWKDGYPEGLMELTEQSLGDENYRKWLTSRKGFYSESEGNWGGGNLLNFDSTWRDNYSAEFDSAYSHLKNIIRLAHEKEITVVGIIFPQSPEFKKTGAFGRYGIRRSEVPEIMDKLDSLSSSYENFILLDENKMGNHDYPDEYAANQDHLNVRGAALLTSRVDSLLKSLEKN